MQSSRIRPLATSMTAALQLLLHLYLSIPAYIIGNLIVGPTIVIMVTMVTINITYYRHLRNVECSISNGCHVDIYVLSISRD